MSLFARESDRILVGQMVWPCGAIAEVPTLDANRHWLHVEFEALPGSDVPVLMAAELLIDDVRISCSFARLVEQPGIYLFDFPLFSMPAQSVGVA